MKITYISNSVLPSPHANAVHVMKMADALAKLGNNVTLFARKGEGEAEGRDVLRAYSVSEEFRLRRISVGSVPILSGLTYAKRVLNETAADSSIDLIYSRACLAIQGHCSSKIPLIFEAHSLPKGYGRRWMEQRLFDASNFRALVVISKALRDDYLKLFPSLRGKRIIVAHDAANRIPAVASSVEPSRAGDIKFHVGYVGHLHEGRGIEVIEALAKAFPNIGFNVVGGIARDVEIWKSRTSTLLNLVFHGFKAHSDLPQFYAGFDVLLAPYQQKVQVAGGRDTSRWMSPMKIFEYMSSGRPIIASRLPVLEEVLKDEVNCLLVEPDNITQWIAALQRIITTESLRHQLAATAFKEFTELYTWERRAQTVLKDALKTNK